MPASQIRFDYTGLDLFFERKFAHIEAAFDRESLRQYLTRENLPYKLLGWAARRVSISAMLGDVFGVGIFLEKLEALNDKDETAFAELLRIYEEHNVRKRFSDLLEREEQRARDKRRYFRSVRQYYEDGKNLDDAFVIIEGCVCAKERLSHESAFGRTINRENGGWLLCDFPPEGMCSKNSETWERVVYLRLDSRMEVLASNGIPFCSEI